MLFKDITYIDDNYNVISGYFIGTQNDKITYISEQAPKDPEIYGRAYNGKNKLLIPGFVNAHSHCAATILRSYADCQALDDWLNNWIFPFESKMTGEDYYWSTVLGLAEMARYGITSCSDMYFEGEDRILAINDSKMKCNMAECIICFDDISFDKHPLYSATLNYVKNAHNSCDGRLKIDMNIHGEYTTKEQICKGISEVAKQYNLINTIHVSETKAEHEQCKQRHNGMTPVQYFDSIGVFESPTLIAHGVWLEDNDLKILKEKNVSVATNPASNMKLGSGIANLPAILNSGINLCLGTDGMASNNNHDIFKDMYLMALLNRAQMHDPTLMTAKEVLYAATRAGSVAQGRLDCGYIKKDFKADLCVMDLSEPIWCPGENILNNLIYASQGSDICLTMVDGQVVYENGQWPYIDIEKVKSQVKSRRKRIVEQS